MKVALAASNVFYNSAAVSLARFPREGAAVKSSRLSRRALLHMEDRASRALEVILRAVLCVNLLFAFGACVWQVALT